MVAGSRLKEILSASGASDFRDMQRPSIIEHSLEVLNRFHHFIVPTLPHLIALLASLSSSFPPDGTGLLVIDSLSTLVSAAYSQVNRNEDIDQSQNKKVVASQWAASRRWAVMGDLISKIGKLAATRKIATLLTVQTTTRIRLENAALLHPALSGTAWEAGINSRLVLFRDWLSPSEGQPNRVDSAIPEEARFVGVVKVGGVSLNSIEMIPFVIEKVRDVKTKMMVC